MRSALALVAVLALVAAGGLFLRTQEQQSEIDSLAERIAKLETADADDEGPIEATSVSRVGSHEATGRRSASTVAAAGTSGGAPSPSSAPRATPTPPRPLKPESRAVADALIDVLDSGDPEVQSRLREIVQSEQESLRDQQRERRQQRWEATVLSRLEKLGGDHPLDSQQQDALFGVLTAERDRIRELFREAGDERDFDKMREQIQRIRAESDAEAQGMLSADQFGDYQSMREEDRQRGPGRRGRRGPPGP